MEHQIMFADVCDELYELHKGPMDELGFQALVADVASQLGRRVEAGLSSPLFNGDEPGKQLTRLEFTRSMTHVCAKMYPDATPNRDPTSTASPALRSKAVAAQLEFIEDYKKTLGPTPWVSTPELARMEHAAVQFQPAPTPKHSRPLFASPGTPLPNPTLGKTPIGEGIFGPAPDFSSTVVVQPTSTGGTVPGTPDSGPEAVLATPSRAGRYPSTPSSSSQPLTRYNEAQPEDAESKFCTTSDGKSVEASIVDVVSPPLPTRRRASSTNDGPSTPADSIIVVSDATISKLAQSMSTALQEWRMGYMLQVWMRVFDQSASRGRCWPLTVQQAFRRWQSHTMASLVSDGAPTHSSDHVDQQAHIASLTDAYKRLHADAMRSYNEQQAYIEEQAARIRDLEVMLGKQHSEPGAHDGALRASPTFDSDEPEAPVPTDSIPPPPPVPPGRESSAGFGATEDHGRAGHADRKAELRKQHARGHDPVDGDVDGNGGDDDDDDDDDTPAPSRPDGCMDDADGTDDDAKGFGDDGVLPPPTNPPGMVTRKRGNAGKGDAGEQSLGEDSDGASRDGKDEDDEDDDTDTDDGGRKGNVGRAVCFLCCVAVLYLVVLVLVAWGALVVARMYGYGHVVKPLEELEQQALSIDVDAATEAASRTLVQAGGLVAQAGGAVIEAGSAVVDYIPRAFSGEL